MAEKLVTPLIHLNGTGDTLVTEYDEASNKFHDFRKAFAAITCHPRDYYPISDSAYGKAREVRDAMMEHIRQIEEYIQDHRIALHQQRDERNAHRRYPRPE